jgi:hypothetical protein
VVGELGSGHRSRRDKIVLVCLGQILRNEFEL